jgi:flagellar protein FlaG
MSSTSVNPEAANMAAPQVLTRGIQSPASPQRVAAENPVPEINAAASLKESIRSVAEKADSDRAHTLQSITNVADDIKEAIDTLNDALAKAPTKAIISHDDQLNRYIVKIADERSGEVIREVPSEAVLKFARNLQEIKGLLFDKAL